MRKIFTTLNKLVRHPGAVKYDIWKSSFFVRPSLCAPNMKIPLIHRKTKNGVFRKKGKKISKRGPPFDSENEIFFPRLYKSFFGHSQSDRRKKMGKKSTFPNHERKRVYIRILSHPIVTNENDSHVVNSDPLIQVFSTELFDPSSESIAEMKKHLDVVAERDTNKSKAEKGVTLLK